MNKILISKLNVFIKDCMEYGLVVAMKNMVENLLQQEIYHIVTHYGFILRLGWFGISLMFFTSISLLRSLGVFLVGLVFLIVLFKFTVLFIKCEKIEKNYPKLYKLGIYMLSLALFLTKISLIIYFNYIIEALFSIIDGYIQEM